MAAVSPVNPYQERPVEQKKLGTVRVNWLLILGCIGATLGALSLAQTPSGTQFVNDNLVFSQNNLFAGRVWTVVTAIFVHASFTHLFGNMLFLFVFGNTLEKRVGHRDFSILFFAGGIISFLGSLPFFPADTGMLGASAAIFSLAAGVMLVSPLKFSWLFLAPQGLVAIIYFVYNAVIVAGAVTGQNPFGYDPSIAYIAHIIGFSFGIPFGVAWSERWKKNLLITLGLFGLYLLIVELLALFFGVNTPFGVF